MLEKIAELVRKGWSEDEFDYVPCQACIYAPLGGDACDLHKHGGVFPDKEAAIEPGIAVYTRECPNPSNPDGSLMLARWAVLLVARGLEKEIDRLSLFRGLPPSEAAMEAAASLGASTYNLITEAKGGGE